jgi:hypothetical protein
VRGALARVRSAPLTAAIVILWCAGAWAGDRVVIEIGTVLATNSSKHFDSQLASMRHQLENLFRYTSYELVKQEDRDVGCGDPAHFEIPGGRHLRVMPKEARADGVSLNVRLLKNSHVLMDTDFTLGNRGTIMVGGPRYEDGVLIIWIGARPGQRPEHSPGS